MDDFLDYADGHKEFVEWLREVDRILVAEIGMGVFDLPDRLWRDEYDENISPREATDNCLEDNGL